MNQNSILNQRYRKVKKIYKKLEYRFGKTLLHNTFSKNKLAKLQKRLQKWRLKFAKLEHQLKWTSSGLALGLGLMTTPVIAQQHTPAFINTVTNPFGFSDIGSLSTPSAFVDLDGDGDLDAFIGGFSGTISYFENTGDLHNPTFATVQNNPFGISDPGTFSSPVFGDLDGDGDLDFITGNGDGDFRFAENTGDKNAPTFTSLSTNPFGLTNVSIGVSAGGISVPTLVDLDGDGDLDLLATEKQGKLYYFENTGNAANPTFATVVENPFGLSDRGRFINLNTKDLDHDGDFDVILGEENGRTYYFENTGNATNPTFASSSTNPFGFVDIGARAYTGFADLDQDGDLDALSGETNGNIIYFENKGIQHDFSLATVVTNPFGFTDVGDLASPALADLDGDGDLDAFVGEINGNTIYFENTGNKVSPTFATASTNPFGLSDVGSRTGIDFADLDGDGDLDVITGNLSGNTLYFENTGTNTNPTFASSVTNPFGLADIGDDAQPIVMDIDGDSDLDILIADGAGDFYYFENTGTNTNPTFASSVTNPFGITNVVNYGKPAVADWDGDGDLDLLTGETTGNFFYFENTGNATNPTFAVRVSNPFGFSDVTKYSKPAFADLDADGDLDVVVGDYYGDIKYFQNQESTPPTWSGSSWSPSTPTSTTHAIINGTYDVNTDGSITAKTLLVNAGESISMSAGTISLSENFINIGSAFSQTAGTFTFNGSNAQVIYGNNSFDNLTINNSAGVGLCSATNVSGVLALSNGTLTTNSQLTLKSTGENAGNTATIDFSGSGSISGNVTVERFLAGATTAGFRYIATNLTSQTIAPVNDGEAIIGLGTTFSPASGAGYTWTSTSPFPNAFFYDESLISGGNAGAGVLNGQSLNNAEYGWETPAATSDALNSGEGFAIRIGASDVTLSFSGTLQTSNVALTLNHGGQTNSGWHLLGNPFAATLDWDAVYEDGDNSGVEPIAYVYETATEFTGNYSGYNASTNMGVNGGTQNIASGQGFFIQTTSGMTGNVTMKPSHTSSSDAQFFRTQDDAPEIQGELRLKLADEAGHEDELLIYFMEDANEGKDLGDAKKFFDGGYGLPLIASHAFNQDLMMDCRKPLGEETQTFALKLKTGTSGNYILKVSTIAQFVPNTQIILEDRLNNTLVDLNQIDEYHFELHTAEEVIQNRFLVHLRVDQTTSLADDLAESGISLFAYQKEITIKFSDLKVAKANIVIYDLMGRVVHNQTTENQLDVVIPIQHRGVYVVKVQNDRGAVTQKVIIQ